MITLGIAGNVRNRHLREELAKARFKLIQSEMKIKILEMQKNEIQKKNEFQKKQACVLKNGGQNTQV